MSFTGQLAFKHKQWSERFFESFVGVPAVGSLPGIRGLVFLILLLNTVWEDLPSLACLPGELRSKMGVMILLRWIPGFPEVVTMPAILWGIKLATCVASLCAALGFMSRLTIPVATALAILHGGLLREYSHFFHTCIVPLHIALILCILPGAHASLWSVAKSAEVRGGEGGPNAGRLPDAYGWTRFACWTAIALAYLSAALAKLWSGGLFWWEGANLKSTVLRDTLNPMHFEWGLEHFFVSLPTSAYAVLGLTSLIIELLYVLVLFSPTARRVFPVLVVGMHLGILFAQGILFFDLILLQAIFYDWSPVLGWLTRLIPTNLRGPVATFPGASPVAANHPVWLIAWLAVIVLNIVNACVGGSFYPACRWGMYSKRSSSSLLSYRKIVEYRADGTSGAATIDRWIGAMKDTRYRDMLSKPKSQQELFFAAVARKARDAGTDIIRFDVEKYVWDWREEPDSPGFGRLVERNSFNVSIQPPPR